MTTILDFGASGSLSTRTSAKIPEQETAGTDDAATPGTTAASTFSPIRQGPGTPILSSVVQGTLIANQTPPQTSSAAVPSAGLIVEADILALDIVQSLDVNHNGTLSKAEIAAVSPLAAWASDSLDTNGDGQVSTDELATAMLPGTSPPSA